MAGKTNLELVTQQVKTVFVKAEIRDDQKKLIGSFEGELLGLSQNIDSESDIRRTATLQAHLSDSGYFQTRFTPTWINQQIWLYVGLGEETSPTWFSLGRYLLTQDSYTYNAQTEELQLSVADLMASITEERGSQIGSEVTITAGDTIHNALEQTVNKFFPWLQSGNQWQEMQTSTWGSHAGDTWRGMRYQGRDSTICSFDGKTVPYDLEFDRGCYPYEFATKLVNLYPCYEQFVSVDGVYTAQEIPNGVDDPLELTADEMDKLIVSDSGEAQPKDIKNATEIWGQELDADYTAETCDGKTTPGTYHVLFDDSFTVLEDGFLFAFTPDVDCNAGQKMQVQDLAPAVIGTMNGMDTFLPIKRGAIRGDIQYVVKYTAGHFVLQGQSNIHVICFEYNAMPSEDEIEKLRRNYGCQDVKIVVNRYSDFSVEKIGVQKQVLLGGEYDNIYTTELAFERASYENWQKARQQETLTLTTLYMPWLDVNKKIEYRSIITGEVHEYMIKAISVNYPDFTMQLSLTRFYPYYPWLRRTNTWAALSKGGKTWKDVSNLLWSEAMYPANN